MYRIYPHISQFFGVGKRELSGATRLICTLYFLPAEGKMFSAILDTQHYGIQPNKSQSQNKIITLLPTNPLESIIQ